MRIETKNIVETKGAGNQVGAGVLTRPETSLPQDSYFVATPKVKVGLGTYFSSKQYSVKSSRAGVVRGLVTCFFLRLRFVRR